MNATVDSLSGTPGSPLGDAPPRALRVGLLGFGTVGASVARILAERPELSDFIQLTHVFNRGIARKRASWVPASVAWTEDLDHLPLRSLIRGSREPGSPDAPPPSWHAVCCPRSRVWARGRAHLLW